MKSVNLKLFYCFCATLFELTFRLNRLSSSNQKNSCFGIATASAFGHRNKITTVTSHGRSYPGLRKSNPANNCYLKRNPSSSKLSSAVTTMMETPPRIRREEDRGRFMFCNFSKMRSTGDIASTAHLNPTHLVFKNAQKRIAPLTNVLCCYSLCSCLCRCCTGRMGS